MNDKIKKKIVILDFNVVCELLAGSSVLAHLKNDSTYNYEVIFNQSCSLEEHLKVLGIKTHRLPFSSSNKAVQFIDLLLLVPRIIYLYLKIRPDLIHANNVLAARFGSIFKVIFGVPLVTHIRNVGFPPRTKWVCNYTDRFACTSEVVASLSLEKECLDRVDIVYDGFEFDSELSDTHRKVLETTHVRIGMCSRLSYQKGVDSFCAIADSFSTNSRYTFYHAGGVPLKGSKDLYSASLAEKYASSVSWLGYVDEISGFWENIDIAVLPARGHEAFGRVVAEAMAAGIPMISSKCGGPEEIIDDGISGVLLDHDDIAGFIEHIELLASNVSLRRKMGEQGRLKIQKKFSVNRYIDRLHRCYRNSLNWNSLS